MAEELVFYTNPMSRGRIVRWMLEEVGAPYRTELLMWGPAMKEAAYLAINPMGKVPAITHGGQVVTEVAAICTYLADAFPQAGLVPSLAHRGAYYRWLFFAAGPFEQAITNKSLGFAIPADREAMAGYGNFDRAMDGLEYAVTQGPYVAGDQFSAADVLVGAQIGFGLMFGSIEKRPAFVDYLGRVSERPAAVRARSIDDALITKQPA
jgi:glutathione S-transferase